MLSIKGFTNVRKKRRILSIHKNVTTFYEFRVQDKNRILLRVLNETMKILT